MDLLIFSTSVFEDIEEEESAGFSVVAKFATTETDGKVYQT